MGGGSSVQKNEYKKITAEPTAECAAQGQEKIDSGSSVPREDIADIRVALASERSHSEHVDACISKLEAQVSTLSSQLESFRQYVKRQPVQISVGTYNILAGYLGNNTEPWFLYGPEVSDARRQEISKLHSMRNPDGRPANAGWPKYVHGVLTEEEQAEVLRRDAQHFAWDQRKDRLVRVIQDMDVDILSLVECDHYEDFFKSRLADIGYDSIWRKRPRQSSKDGCCIAWRREKFECFSNSSIEYVDKFDAVAQKNVKDRIALVSLMRVVLTGDVICFVSTHLARNPEDADTDRLRARQIGQVLRKVSSFVQEQGFPDAPVLLAGDMNATSFGRLRGIASAISLMTSNNTFIHPFTFDCRDIPTGATSCTTARNVRIDAIMYQSQRLELVDVCKLPKLSSQSPIPNAEHPSDHLPIYATFRLATKLQIQHHVAREWFLRMSGQSCMLPLNSDQLQDAFNFYDHDGTQNLISPLQLVQAINTVVGSGVVSPHEIEKVMAQLPPEGTTLETFCAVYGQATRDAGIPGMEELKDAFQTFDKDKDGVIDLAEFLAMFRECSPAEPPEAELQDLFKKIDVDGSNTICINNFLEHLAVVWVASHCSNSDILQEAERVYNDPSRHSLS